MADFPPLDISSSDSWGPTSVPDQFTSIPYQPFSKGDRLGKVADFTGTTTSRRDRYGHHYGAGGDAFSYYHEDESSFQLVDTSKQPKHYEKSFRRNYHNRRYNTSNVRRAAREQRGLQSLAKNKNLSRDRQRLERKLNQKWRQSARRRYDRRQLQLEASVDVRPSWKIIQDIEFSKLQKLQIKDISEPEDVLSCGAVYYYDRTVERITPKMEKPLDRSFAAHLFFPVSTSDDPVMQKFMKEKRANVFATDQIMSWLMSTSRSVFSWDIIVTKKDGVIVFDKRDGGPLDYLTVDETSAHPPSDEDGGINSASSLASESTRINQAFSRQCLTRDVAEKFKASNPFGSEASSYAYKYRKWDMKGGFTLISRCEVDGVVKSKGGQDSVVAIKAFNEWNAKANTGTDWRSSLDNQSGSILATQIKDNTSKVAQWAIKAVLSGAEQFRLGFVSRSPRGHGILQVQAMQNMDTFLSQLNLNMNNCWGIFRSIVNVISREEDGTYLILRDPSKSTIKIYNVPEDAFEQSEEEEEEDDDDEDVRGQEKVDLQVDAPLV